MGEEPAKAWRGQVDGDPTTDGISQEDKDVGHSEELAPLHEVCLAFWIKERNQGRVEHVEDGRPVFHREVAKELSCKEGNHAWPWNAAQPLRRLPLALEPLPPSTIPIPAILCPVTSIVGPSNCFG